MFEVRVRVASKVGLHARPAALIARLAAEQPVTVTIRKEGGEPVPAASLLNLMTLGAMHGDEVILAAEGDAAQSSVDKVAELIESDEDSA
ncbi:HPr family phosphocarrier protein [Kibdelosporangium phytohabitans]|uniref:Phosphocarrier protein HPr n=1 Tax=Kibdelosporangium phytohabitans TaxID=860235 RepID=A0A0N9IAV1_9PSEU|nr:HPr family phosphocarrier protein [Kibdelosporangium phytohabitans]ALG11700.1 dihydroxyacetone kinase [Kibdelosporangium phytohabitans]MBE1463093.1 phosphotransferase system HPr (HPr) family protein [Kibdelosporangium phytohabitans]